MRSGIKKLSICGYKSIRELIDLELKDLNIIIGANGAGKSNFVQVFRMLIAMSKKGFQLFVLERGGADDFLFNGPKVTQKVTAEFEFESDIGEGSNFYRFELKPTVDGKKFLIEEDRKHESTRWWRYGGPSEESRLYDLRDEKSQRYESSHGVGYFVYHSISRWMVYHFHDTSQTAPMRRSEIIEHSNILREDASNIAPFLLRLKTTDRFAKNYQEIVNAVRLVIPFFDDFRLDIQQFGESEKVRLSWQQKGSDYPMQPYHFSDGSIRFICLATALLQPDPPSTILIDEPELGLHPEAISILAELIKDASKRTQIIVATQSPNLLNEFAIDDIIVASRKGKQSTFERLSEQDFNVWLEDYSVGELWTKNVIQGGTTHE